VAGEGVPARRTILVLCARAAAPQAVFRTGWQGGAARTPGTNLDAGDAGGLFGGPQRVRDDFAARQPARRAAVPLVCADRPFSGGGGRRPRRAGDQADALPGERKFPRGPGASARRRERQAGHRGGRAQGPLRRGQQHRLGAAAGRIRRARGLRRGRAQGALQDAAGGAARGRRNPPLRPSRHRQLQRQDCRDLHRHGHHDRGFRPLFRRGEPLQCADRLLVAAGGVAQDRRFAVRHAPPGGGADRA